MEIYYFPMQRCRTGKILLFTASGKKSFNVVLNYNEDQMFLMRIASKKWFCHPKNKNKMPNYFSRIRFNDINTSIIE